MIFNISFIIYYLLPIIFKDFNHLEPFLIKDSYNFLYVANYFNGYQPLTIKDFYQFLYIIIDYKVSIIFKDFKHL